MAHACFISTFHEESKKRDSSAPQLKGTITMIELPHRMEF